MNDKSSQKSPFESKLFEIPIDEYEKDMETEYGKAKKKEILDLFTRYNKLRSPNEFNEIKENLHKACRGGDTNLIKIYLSETIANESNTLLFKIDETNQTASLFKVNAKIDEINIPRTVQHKSINYLITSISGIGIFTIKTLKFTEDSAVKTIYKNSLAQSNIKEIYLPASLIELKEGWCYQTNNLTKIKISPLNGQFIFKDDKYLLGKSNKDNDEFDNLLFLRRDIKEFSIPSNIKIISSYAFENCNNLTKVEIPTNSNLEIIEKYAFSFSKIKEIFIPSKVSKICNRAFSVCFDLEKVVIPTNSNLEIIEKFAFAMSQIKEICIPSKVLKIYEYAFYHCKNLTKFEIPTNANLQTIYGNSLAQSNIKRIYFPDTLKELEEGWCCETNYLTKIDISPSNDRFKFKKGKYLLGKSDESKNKFDVLLFASRDIKKISIPKNIKVISSYAFEYCKKLEKVKIPQNSKLKKIGKKAFYNSSIKEIYIPSKVSQICEKSFSECNNLTNIEIPINSNLKIIDKYAFSFSKIEEFFIPQKVSKIYDSAFLYCSNLQIIEISEKSKLKSIPLSSFHFKSNIIIMIPFNFFSNKKP